MRGFCRGALVGGAGSQYLDVMFDGQPRGSHVSPQAGDAIDQEIKGGLDRALMKKQQRLRDQGTR